ncbi:alanine--glyoxylate aminotransferase-like [Daphnia pulicaria]|uniref:alanine--glyoxylate aminotransferase-like n=1 Tax=Daphnia pulicaria TaxID=35523 RepID=UPI001EEC0ECF|nr:alanine--glyoxylate aminotransferase-like [Daphnia pulicaria]
MAVDYQPPQCLSRPIEVPSKLLMGAGPSNAAENVLKAGSLPLLGHLHTEFTQIMDDVKQGIQYAFQTTNTLTLAISGTGHAGMEAALCNLIERNDVVLIGINGIWGERAADMANRQGADVQTVTKVAGENFSLADIEAALLQHKPAVLFLAQGESSTGVVQPIEGFGALCTKHNCLLLVDTVASLGGEPFYMDRWQVDVVYTGSQKVLGAPPGTAPISFGPRAVAKIAGRKTPISSFYFDMNWLGNYWGCDSQPRKYHHTAPISSIYALREALALLANEGLENSWNRHRQSRDRLISGLAKLNLKPLASEPAARLTCITAIQVPDGVDWKSVTTHAMSMRVEIAGGLGPTAGRIWRVGLMGQNATDERVDRVLEVLAESIKSATTPVTVMGRL